MDPPQVPGVYLVLNMFRGNIISPDAIKPANVGLYLSIIGLEAAVRMEYSLWQAIHMDGAINMQRVRPEFLYTIEIQRLILRELAWAIRSDALYLPMQA